LIHIKADILSRSVQARWWNVRSSAMSCCRCPRTAGGFAPLALRLWEVDQGQRSAAIALGCHSDHHDGACRDETPRRHCYGSRSDLRRTAFATDPDLYPPHCAHAPGGGQERTATTSRPPIRDHRHHGVGIPW